MLSKQTLNTVLFVFYTSLLTPNFRRTALKRLPRFHNLSVTAASAEYLTGATRISCVICPAVKLPVQDKMTQFKYTVFLYV